MLVGIYVRFQALDCVRIANARFVRVDTSLDCDSAESQSFQALDAMLIAIYLGIPALWFVLLYRHRNALNPRMGDERLKYFFRDQDEDLNWIRFLFQTYRPNHYCFEVFEM